MNKITLFFKKEYAGFLILKNIISALILSYGMDEQEKGLLYIDKAISYYDEIREYLKPKDYIDDSLYGVKADILQKMGKLDEALFFINKAIEFNPKDIDLYEGRAEILYSLKDYENAIKDYTKLIEYKYSIFNIAAKSLKQLYYYNRGVSKFWLDDYNGAIIDYTSAIMLNPKNHIFYFERGKAKTWLDDYNGAIEDYTASIKLKSNYYGIYVERAKAYYNLDKKKLAMNDINFALHLMKNKGLDNYTDGKIFSAKAFLLFEKDKNKALDFLIEVQKNVQKDKDVLYVALSYIFFSLDNYKKALKYANLAILKNPENGTAYYRKKCALEALGRKEEAREYFEKAIKLGYEEVF